MRIGLDFDNTLASYEAVFPRAALALGLVPPGFAGGKAEVRGHLRAAGQETEWMRLQGRVYGALMPEAEMIDGVAPFMAEARRQGARLFVVSHKTVHGHFDPDRVDLRRAALDWMEAKGFFAPDGFGLDRADIHFADDRAAKVARIAELGLDVFVDDLEEVFREPGFPAATRAILFTNNRPGPGDLDCRRHWDDITRTVFSGA